MILYPTYALLTVKSRSCPMLRKLRVLLVIISKAYGCYTHTHDIYEIGTRASLIHRHTPNLEYSQSQDIVKYTMLPEFRVFTKPSN